MKRIVGLSAASIIVLSLASTTAAAAEADSDTVLWPYVGSDDRGAVDETETWVELMEAFGATTAQAQAAASYDATMDSSAAPDAIAGAEPSRVEAGISEAFTGSVSVYADGSLSLSLVQTAPFESDTDSVIEFASASVDISDIANAAAEDVSIHSLAGGEIGTQSITGCTALPNSGGWTRRADCYVYTSMTPPIISASAWLDYSVKSAGGRIDALSSNDVNCGPTVASSGSTTIHRKQNVGSTPARGIHNIYCAFPTGGQGFIQNVYAYGSVWATDNFHL